MKLKNTVLALAIAAITLSSSACMNGSVKIATVVEQTCSGANSAEEGLTQIRHDTASKFISDSAWQEFQAATVVKHKYCSRVPLPTSMTEDDWKDLNGAIGTILSHYASAQAAKTNAK